MAIKQIAAIVPAMKISEIGGEFALLSRVLSKSTPRPDVVLPNGDDAAVVRVGGDLLALCSDTFVEGKHFTRRHFSAYQIGKKAVEATFSDLIAVGARPAYFLLNLVSCDEELSFIENVVGGCLDAATRLGAILLGGDTTSSIEGLMLSVSAVGKVPALNWLTPRSGAKEGDLVVVTGDLGRSAAGLHALNAGLSGYESVKLAHLEPRCRLDLLNQVAPASNAAIDISDGLASELHHLCAASGCGVEIEADLIPISQEVRGLSTALKLSALDLALGGGEDFELLYTLAPEKKSQIVGHQIGVVTSTKLVNLRRNSRVEALAPHGYKHFNS